MVEDLCGFWYLVEGGVRSLCIWKFCVGEVEGVHCSVRCLTTGRRCCVQWSDKKQYNETLKKLGGLFQKNFEVYADYKVGGDSKLTERILAAGPRL